MPALSTKIPEVDYTFDQFDRAQEQWLVINAANEQEAINATPEPGTEPIRKRGQQHPRNAFLKVQRNPVRNHEGPTTWIVGADYSIPPTGEFPTPAPDPIDRLVRISWTPGKVTLQTDVTIDNKPIVNSAGDAIGEAGQSRIISVYQLTIRKWYMNFDFPRSRNFTNTVNSNDFVSGGQTFLAGEVYCDSISPVSDYDLNASRLEIAHNFVISMDLREDGQSRDPFQLHLKDAGRRAFGNFPIAPGSGTVTPKLGELFYRSSDTATNGYYTVGEALSEDVPLDGTGKPIDLKIITVLDRAQGGVAPVTNPNLTNQGQTMNSAYSTPQAKILSFKVVRAVNFALLNL